MCQIKINLFFSTEGISEQQFQIIELTNFFVDCIFLSAVQKGRKRPCFYKKIVS